MVPEERGKMTDTTNEKFVDWSEMNKVKEVIQVSLNK